MRYLTIVVSFLAIICFPISVESSIKMSDYMEGDFDYDKWFGTTTQTTLVRSYTQHNGSYLGLLNANWDMHESTGPNGGPLEDGTWTSSPFLHFNTWHMNSYSDGTVREVGDSYPMSGCTIKYSPGKEILWGVGNMNVGQLYANQLHYTGCGENWGWVDVQIVNHHATHTIPEVDLGSWSCPETTFNDVIEIEHTQWFCEDSSCNSQSEHRFRYWFAKGFGAIRLWSYPGRVIRLVCDEDTKACQCAGDILP